MHWCNRQNFQLTGSSSQKPRSLTRIQYHQPFWPAYRLHIIPIGISHRSLRAVLLPDAGPLQESPRRLCQMYCWMCYWYNVSPLRPDTCQLPIHRLLLRWFQYIHHHCPRWLFCCCLCYPGPAVRCPLLPCSVPHSLLTMKEPSPSPIMSLFLFSCSSPFPIHFTWQ